MALLREGRLCDLPATSASVFFASFICLSLYSTFLSKARGLQPSEAEALPLHALPRLILKIKEEFAHADLRQIRARGKSHYFLYLTIIPRGFVLIGDNHT